MVWDVKIDFTRKAGWVKDGYKTVDPLCSNYDGMVSRERVRTAFTYLELNGFNAWATDIHKAHIQSPTSEKHYFICGPKF